MNDITPEPARQSSFHERMATQSGKVGWALLWLLGVPLPILLIIYLIRGH